VTGGAALAVLAACAVLTAAGVGLRLLWRRWWSDYVSERTTLFQPAILMAIANEESKKLGPPFSDARRPGDWNIVEDALFQWSKGLRGFALQGFCRIYEENGFTDAERLRLKSLFWKRRAAAAQRLGQMLCTKAIPELLTALGDSSPEVRRLASWALANMGQSVPGVKESAGRPETEAGMPLQQGAMISGRFLWDSGEPVQISEREESAYLLHETGGMTGTVQSLVRKGPGGRAAEAVSHTATYRTGYEVRVQNTRQAVSLKAVLKQAVGGYYSVTVRRRDGIPLADGCRTENVDFVFPRYADPDDQVSVQGELRCPAEMPSGYKKTDTPAARVVLESADGEFHTEYLSYAETKTYRLHDVPPGRCRLHASFAAFHYEGELEVRESQPMTFHIPLRPGLGAA